MRVVWFSIFAMFVAAAIAGCATTTAPKPSSQTVAADLEKAAAISKVADMFSAVPSGEARDCMQYALFKGLAGDNILNLSDTSKKQASREIKDVWQQVFNNKLEAEQKEAVDNSQLRVKARQSGELEKLSEEKCLVPVFNKLTEVKSGYWVEK